MKDEKTHYINPPPQTRLTIFIGENMHKQGRKAGRQGQDNGLGNTGLKTEGVQRGDLTRGAAALIENGKVTREDRVLVVADNATRRIADLIERGAKERGAAISVIIMEDFGTRPLTEFPKTVRARIQELAPTVSYFAASCQAGEFAFRKPMLVMLKELEVRHIHMPGVTEAIVGGAAMCADYDKIGRLTAVVHNIVRNAKCITITSDDGSTRLDIELDPEHLKWISVNGRPVPEEWVNNPEGEVFNTPSNVNGWLTTRLLGDHFDSKGQLKKPIKIWISDGKAVRIVCDDKDMEAEFWAYLKKGENTDRVGEIGLPTNFDGMISGEVLGNMLADEKVFLHIAFGDPIGEETGATWAVSIPGDPKATQHCDVTIEGCDITVDGFKLMEHGRYAREVLERAGIETTI